MRLETVTQTRLFLINDIGSVMLGHLSLFCCQTFTYAQAIATQRSTNTFSFFWTITYLSIHFSNFFHVRSIPIAWSMVRSSWHSNTFSFFVQWNRSCSWWWHSSETYCVIIHCTWTPFSDAWWFQHPRRFCRWNGITISVNFIQKLKGQVKV